MSRSFKPCELYYFDVQEGGKMRGEITLVAMDGENAGKEIRIDNHLASDRYPELSFLFPPFDVLYERHKDNDTALKFLDDIESSLKFIAEESIGRSDPVPFKGEYDDTVEAWFYGKMDKNFYYNEINNRLFEEYLEMQIARRTKSYELYDIEEDIHIDADISRTNEKIYTYRIGKTQEQDMFVDIYAGKNEKGEYIVHNYYTGQSYTFQPDGDRQYFKIDSEVERSLEKDVLARINGEF